MSLTLQRSLEAIATHSNGLADAATGNLNARVEHCPDWSVADLLRHVTEVHWVWRTIAGERLPAPPDESRRPDRRPDDELVEAFRAGAAGLVETLGSADQEAGCWTWYPPRQDVGFITRHQVQEVAVHHWDAAHAAGRSLTVDSDVATDSVEEFLTCSLADEEDAQRVGRSLDGTLVLRDAATGHSWTVSQEDHDGALVWSAPTEGTEPTVTAESASDLLLWLYQRVDLTSTDPGLVSRFRSLSSTD